MIAQRLSTISGVAQVNVHGSQKFAVRAQLDPKALASRQIGIDEVAAAIGDANVNLPTGVLEGAKQTFTIEANGQMFKAAAYRQMVVAYRDGSPVRLEELGKVIDTCREHQNGRLVQQLPRHRPDRSAPTRHQHHPGRGQRQEAAADLPQPDAGLGRAERAVRPLCPDP